MSSDGELFEIYEEDVSSDLFDQKSCESISVDDYIEMFEFNSSDGLSEVESCDLFISDSGDNGKSDDQNSIMFDFEWDSEFCSTSSLSSSDLFEDDDEDDCGDSEANNDDLFYSSGNLDLGATGFNIECTLNNLSADTVQSITGCLEYDRKCAIEKIELLILDILDGISNEQQIQFNIECSKNSNQPFKRIKNLYRISSIINVASKLYKELQNNTTCCKRQIYYMNPELFYGNKSAEPAIRDLCTLLKSHQWTLGIKPVSKGLMAGIIKITNQENRTFLCESVNEGMLIPFLYSDMVEMESDALFVLVVEKHAVFDKLLEQKFLVRYGQKCILVTGKGYPDISTRFFLNKIWNILKLPIYGLFDADPYGIEILLTYQQGSQYLYQSVDYLSVPEIQWIGIRPSDIKKIGLKSMLLTKNDEMKLDRLLKRPLVIREVYEELLFLIRHKVKAEIEFLTEKSYEYFTNIYLPERIKEF